MSTNPGRIIPDDESTSAPVMDQAKEQVQEVGERAQAAVGEATAKADVKVREEIDQRSTDAGTQLSASADALRSSSDELRSQGNAMAAQVADRAADQAHRLGAYLEDADADPDPRRRRTARPSQPVGGGGRRRGGRRRGLAVPERHPANAAGRRPRPRRPRYGTPDSRRTDVR